MKTNEVKKALYKQKPIAEVDYERSGFVHYSTEVIIDNLEEIAEFKVPTEETIDQDGNEIFGREMPAQLLIRWLKQS